MTFKSVGQGRQARFDGDTPFPRLTNGITHEGGIIPAGSRTICHARSSIVATGGKTLQNIHTKLDTCGSVSIAHSSYLTQVKRAAEHGLPQIRLTGIGEKSGILNRVGIVQLRTPEGRVKRIQIMLRIWLPLGTYRKDTSSESTVIHRGFHQHHTPHGSLSQRQAQTFAILTRQQVTRADLQGHPRHRSEAHTASKNEASRAWGAWLHRNWRV